MYEHVQTPGAGTSVPNPINPSAMSARRRNRSFTAQISGKGSSKMASTVLPFEAVEQNMKLFSNGVSVSERLNKAYRLAYQLFLAFALHNSVKFQQGLIAALESGSLQDRSSSELNDIALRLDALADVVRLVVFRARHVEFSLWDESVETLDRQREKLESLAESYRLSASREFTAYVGELVQSAERSDEGEVDNWRDFVATLHD